MESISRVRRQIHLSHLFCDASRSKPPAIAEEAKLIVSRSELLQYSKKAVYGSTQLPCCRSGHPTMC